MTGQTYREALGRAAQTLRTERGYKSVAALVRDTKVSGSTAYRVEGSKEREKDLMLATIEDYARAVGITMADLFRKADELYAASLNVPRNRGRKL